MKSDQGVNIELSSNQIGSSILGYTWHQRHSVLLLHPDLGSIISCVSPHLELDIVNSLSTQVSFPTIVDV